MLWFMLACVENAPSDPPVETDTDTDTDADSDTDTDADSDTDSDTDTDTGPYDPALAGPFAVSDTFVEVGPRPVRVWRPDDTASVPVVVLMHGFQLTPAQYASYGEHLASRGMAVVSPRFSGTLFVPTSHADLGDEIIGVLDWIDTQPAELGPIDPSRLLLAGHSLGGKIAALVGSLDARPDGLFLIDPVDATPPFTFDPVAWPSVTPERMGDITVPIVSLGETFNQGGLQPCAPAGENFEQYAAHATTPTLQVELVGADHMAFLDDPACGLSCDACPDGPADPVVVRATTQTLLAAFAEHQLSTDARATDWLDDVENQFGTDVVIDRLRGF